MSVTPAVPPVVTPAVPPVATPDKVKIPSPAPEVVQLVPEQAAVVEEVVPVDTQITESGVVATSTPISNQLAAVAGFIATNSTILLVLGFMTTMLALGYFISKYRALKKVVKISFISTQIEEEE